MSRYKLATSEHDSGSKFTKLPEGEYVFQVIDYKETNKEGNPLVTKAGDPMIQLTLEVVSPSELEGRKVWHNVIYFQPTSPSIKGIGMTRHFLHCCGLAWEGDLATEPTDFIGKKIKATIIHNGDYVNLDEIILDETLFSKTSAAPATPSDIEWSE